MRLRGRACIITGATRGLGRQIALRFWEEGASLLLAGRDPVELQTLSDSITSPRYEGQKLAVALCDLSEPAAALDLVGRATSEFESVTALVNNAATLGPIGPLWMNKINDWENTIRVNLLAPVALCQLLIPHMHKCGYGKIVNLSGGGATGPRPYFSAYATAKAGLVRFTEVLAHELRNVDIDVNCIAPGVMQTGMLDEILEAGPDRVGAGEHARAQQQAAQSSKTLERASELAAFLVSSQSDGISGRLISAVWDAWEELPQRKAILEETDIYTLRRIVPKDRGLDWGKD